MAFNPLRRRQLVGFSAGLSVIIVFVMVLAFYPKAENLNMIGPLNTGHEDLACIECHTPARGTLGQQIQTNLMFAMGKRKTKVEFGLENVDNNKCLACHDRPNDRHPVHRFEEPRFAEARKAINPTKCASCHTEHHGIRITIESAAFCANCHQDTEMNNDPLDISHKELIAQGNWNSCLQCHDFHGNHVMHVAEKMQDTISLSDIVNYFKGGASPYPDKKQYYPKETILE